VEWQYDALGQRIRQTTWSWLVQSNLWAVTEDLKFLSDPLLFGRHLVDLNASNNVPVRTYVWGLDLSGTMDGAGGVGGLLWVTLHTASGPAAGTHFVAYDGNGNIVALSGASDGSESARYEYGPFGEPIRVTGPAAALNPFRFSTKRTDNTTDLVLYEYRAYSPTSGRWLSRDPIMEAGSLKLYAFLLNDPIDDVDLFGLMNCQRDRFEFELGTFMKWIPFKGEEDVGNAWIRAEVVQMRQVLQGWSKDKPQMGCRCRRFWRRSEATAFCRHWRSVCLRQDHLFWERFGFIGKRALSQELVGWGVRNSHDWSSRRH
jgi:RHS repeat-associated protein